MLSRRAKNLRAVSILLLFGAFLTLIAGIRIVQGPVGDEHVIVANMIPVTGEDVNVQSSAARLLIVGADESYPPYSYLENGRPAGFDVDLIEAVAEERGMELQIVMGPWHEMVNRLYQGEVDVLLGASFSYERENWMDFSTPYASGSMDLFVPEGSPVDSLNDLAGKDIVVQEGRITHEYLKAQNLAGRLITVGDTAVALQLLKSGDYDAALLPQYQALYLIGELGVEGIQPVGLRLEPIPAGFAVRDGESSLLMELNESLNILATNGQMDELRSRWFGVVETTYFSTNLRLLGGALGIAAILLFGALLWSVTLRREVNLRTKALRHSEEAYRRLVDNASEAVVVVCENKFVFTNPRTSEMSGYSHKELESMAATDLIHPDDLELVTTNHTSQLEQMDSKLQYSCRITTRRGEMRWVLVNAVRIDWEGKPASLDLIADISQIKQAEYKIRRQLEQMAALQKIDTAIADSTALCDTLRLLLEQVSSQLEVDAGDVLLLDRDTNTLSYAADHGFRTSAMRTARLQMGQGYAGTAAKERRPILISALSGAPKDMLSSERLDNEGFRAYYGTPLIAKGEVLGVLELYQRRPFEATQEWMNFVDTMASQAAIAIHNADLINGLEIMNQSLVQAYDRTIEGWAKALELRDNDTQGHSVRVTDLTVELARRMNIPEDEIVHVWRGALLHDMGKMGIPDSILRKEGPLNPQEWEIMRQHPVHAYEMLKPVKFLQPALDIPYCHHEKWDGSGYPRGLQGEEIPLAARIFAVVDVWDALREKRSYRDAWPASRVWTYIMAESGNHFDPAVVAAFIKMMKPELKNAHNRMQTPLAAD